MNNLLKEYLSYIQEEGPGEPLPDELETLYHKGYGRYYHDPQFTQYAGRVANKQWYPAKSVQPSPQKKTGVAKPQTQPGRPQPTQEPSTSDLLQSAIETDKAAIVTPSTETRSVEVMGNLFSEEPTVLSRGNETIIVRSILHPENGRALNMSNPDDRAIALAILNKQIEELMPKAKEKAKRMSQSKISKSERQQLRKWLGNMGELCGLRDILSGGGEAYLYADSHPKNDIAVIFEYDSGSDVRDIMVVGVSTKSSAGSQGGRKESSSQPFVMESVEGKPIMLGNEQFDAEDAVVALYSIHKLIYTSSTRGYVQRGKHYKEEREFFVPDEDLGKFDVDMLRTAQAEQQTAALRGEAGGQKKFVDSRVLSVDDINIAFDKQSKAYNRIVKKVMKSMGVANDDQEGMMKATRLVDFYVDKLRGNTANSTEDKPYRLSNTNDFLTDEVVFMLEETNSNFSFESDLMTADFDTTTGYLGMRIVPKEVMTQRAIDKYGDFTSMSKREQLIKLGNWTFNTRGLGLSSRAGGYIDPLARVSPPLEILNDDDKLEVEKYLEYLKLLHLQRLQRNNGN